jgi:hypothetical protein
MRHLDFTNAKIPINIPIPIKIVSWSKRFCRDRPKSTRGRSIKDMEITKKVTCAADRPSRLVVARSWQPEIIATTVKAIAAG